MRRVLTHHTVEDNRKLVGLKETNRLPLTDAETLPVYDSPLRHLLDMQGASTDIGDVHISGSHRPTTGVRGSHVGSKK